jgi:hypothetical protein
MPKADPQDIMATARSWLGTPWVHRGRLKDLAITWVRRTRHGGAWRDLVDVPLNEASEAYEVDVLDGAGEVVRTLPSTTPSVVYTADDQVADFGAPQSSIDIAVYQLSAAVCRGFAGRATL